MNVEPVVSSAGDVRRNKSPYVVVSDANEHAARAQKIIREHPEVKNLFGRNPWSAVVVLGIVVGQIAIAYFLQSSPWWVVVLAAFFVGAFANHALWVMVHECAHLLIFKSKALNRWLAVLANLCMVVPATVGFCIHHLTHHKFISYIDHDTDVAMRWEAFLMHGGFFRRFLWNALFPLTLAVRAAFAKKEGQSQAWVRMMWPNIIIVLAFDVLLWMWIGPMAVLYLLLSAYFSTAAHPLSARWIQEHYVFRDGQETYSYYGPLNKLAFNIGYHNEHHDLPKVPWNRLPRLKMLAANEYDPLYAHYSWTGLWLRYLFEKELRIFRFARLKLAGKDTQA